jgi:hypothetical protein
MMKRIKIFISSVQSEFTEERQMLFEYLTTDSLLGMFFEPFVFENIPALNATPETVFLQEVENCDIYMGLFGKNYGCEDIDKRMSLFAQRLSIFRLTNRLRLTIWI